MEIEIRDAFERDFDSIQKIYSHYVTNGLASFELFPPDKKELLFRWSQIRVLNHPYLVAEVVDKVVGYAYASTYRQRPAYEYTLENSVYVSPDFLDRGIGTQLLDKLIEVCANLGYRQLIAVIGDSENYPSFSLHQKCGFERVGLLPSTGFKHGKWVDTVLMQRHVGNGDKTPPS